jgi:hypothetical protein
MVLILRKYGLVVLSLLIISCSKPGQLAIEDRGFDGPLFRTVPAEQSAIDFANNLPETDELNGFVYEYFYNGGGVGIGDVNGDGLEDLYFTSNLEDNKLYLNRGGLTFEDVTNNAGVAGGKGWATGVSMIDLNQDGLMDIYVCQSGAFTDPEMRRNQLFINQGSDKNGIPKFVESAAAYGIDDPSHTVQSAFLDYDRDGDLDLFLANHNPEAPPQTFDRVLELHQAPTRFGGNKIYRNTNNSFEDVSDFAGIKGNRMNYTLGVSVGDVNNDGWPDIYTANDYSEPDYLYLNNQDGTFKDVTQQSLSHIPNASMGTDIADVNNDGLQDIITLDMAAADNYSIKTSMSGMNPERFYGHVEAGLHRQYMFNALQLNSGNFGQDIPLFSDIAHMAGVSSTDWSWAPLLADFDNDGHKDLFITNGVKRDFINNDYRIFLASELERIESQQQDPKFYYDQLTQAAPTREKVNYIFKNNGDLTYSDFSDQWGISGSSVSNGAAYADLDNDGDLDLVVNNVDAPAYLLENLLDQQLNYLSFSFLGPENNRNGIGAKVMIESKGSLQVQELNPTRGFQSSVSQRLQFGVGEQLQIDQVRVRWPDGKQQILSQVETNQHIQLDYQDATVVEVPPPTVSERLFSDHTDEVDISFRHKENPFNDFERESLLPHRMSQQGPALAVGDINNDGRDDFYIGGAKDQAGSLFLQDQSGAFHPVDQQTWDRDKNYEDVDASFFDVDNDKDLDLLVVSGGNEFQEGSKFYRSRIYENIGEGSFRYASGSDQFPSVSGSVVRPIDFDNDGDTDLFLGGRQKPGKYPFPVNSFLLRNESASGVIQFEDVTATLLPELNEIGMVTDAAWTDLDGDQLPELVICGEWMGIKVYQNGQYGFSEIFGSGLDQYKGWWYSIATADFDKDGDQDLIVGNHGLNNKYKATNEEPFQVYTTDFDNNGSYDIVLGYYNDGELFPLRGRECTSNQMPFVKRKFTTYEAFGKATLTDVYGPESLSSALHYQVNTFATTYFENNGDLTFEPKQIENLAQISSAKALMVEDFDEDGNLDLVLAGNMYETEVETPRNDASYGLFLQGDGQGGFNCIYPSESGLYVVGDVKKSALLGLNDGTRCILFARNGAKPALVKIKSSSNLAQLTSGHEINYQE